jgi:hypothetical protein
VRLRSASSPSADCTADLALTRRYLPWLVAVALFMENLDATIETAESPVRVSFPG